MALLTGTTVGDFEILEEIGRGAMGVVFKARQVSIGRIVALKFLPRELATDKNRILRFTREARAAGRLNHPNIVNVHDVGQAEGLYYIAMEYVDGKSALTITKEQGQLKEYEVLNIGIQVALALQVAHLRGIFHRDVKPDNILIDKNGCVRLADLGLALLQDDTVKGKRITGYGTALGTPHYMPPEQVKGENADARSDLYSLGATLYFLASGKTPFFGTSAVAIMSKVLTQAPHPLKEYAPHLSPAFIELVEKLLQKNPQNRYQSAEEVTKSLEKLKLTHADGVRRTSVSGKNIQSPPILQDNIKPALGIRVRAKQRASQTTSEQIYALAGGAFVVVVVIILIFAGRKKPSSFEAPQRTAAAVNRPRSSSENQQPKSNSSRQNPNQELRPLNFPLPGYMQPIDPIDYRTSTPPTIPDSSSLKDLTVSEQKAVAPVTVPDAPTLVSEVDSVPTADPNPKPIQPQQKVIAEEPLAKIAIQPVPVKEIKMIDWPEELKKSGWDEVKGSWSPDPAHPGWMQVKDGTLIANTKDGTMEFFFLVTPETVLGVYARFDATRKRSATSIGYGVQIIASEARVCAAGKTVSAAQQLNQTPTVMRLWPLSPGLHKATLMVQTHKLTVSIDDQSYIENFYLPSKGGLALIVAGEALIEKPRLLKQ